MNINVEHQPNCRAIAHVRVPGAEVAKHRDEITAYYARAVRLPGYRPGKVPRPVVAKRYSQEINSELEDQLVRRGLQEAIKNEGLEVLNIVSVTDKLHHDTDASFSFSVEMSLAPKFELPDYKGIPIKLPRIEVTEADIDHDLLHLLERYAKFEDVERPAAIGDCAVISYEVTSEGQPVADLAPDAPDHLKTVNENWFLLDAEEDFLPGFYAALQGIAKGDQKTITIDLPADFQVEALAGKTLQFAATCAGVKEKKIPEVSEDFAKQIGGEEFTVEALRGEVSEAIRRRREQARETAKTNQVLAFLAERLEFDLPQEVVNREAQRRTNEIASRAMQSGMANDEIIKHQEEIIGTATNQARQNVKISFILGEVARKENLTVGDQQLSMALARISAQSKMPAKKFMAQAQKSGMIDQLRDDLLIENALTFLKDNAAVEETEPEPEHCETHGHGTAPAAEA